MLTTLTRSSKSIIRFAFVFILVTGTGGCLSSSLTADTNIKGSGFTVSPHSTLSKPFLSAYLYNPTVDEITLKYPFADEIQARQLEPTLVIQGNGLPDRAYSLVYRIMSQQEVLYEGNTEVTVRNGWFELEDKLKDKLPNAEGVSWELFADGASFIKGESPFSWSRFHGKVKYLSGLWRSTYIDLIPLNWRAPGLIKIPVADDGSFDARVPARVYAVVMVNGTGYNYDALERWAWDYDLTRDREDLFTIGRTELYSMHAFGIVGGGLPTIFVAFRPTSVSRVLQFDVDGGGLQEEERKKVMTAMKESQSPTVIGPELEAQDVKVWLNDKEQKVVQFNQIPEYDGEIWQVQYLLQIFPDEKPARGVWHEIKVEVRSKEKLDGEEIVDFGQGSVGFYRP